MKYFAINGKMVKETATEKELKTLKIDDLVKFAKVKRVPLKGILINAITSNQKKVVI